MARAMEKEAEQSPAQPGLLYSQEERLVGLEGRGHGGQSPKMFKVMASVLAILNDSSFALKLG